MRVFVTGAGGFVTGTVARRLIARGDTVRALVRGSGRPSSLEGADLVRGDLDNADALRTGMDGADAVIHGAAMYEIGLSRPQKEQMHEANVRRTAHVLSAAKAAGVQRVVYISTIAVFGNTHGRVIDETYKRTDRSPRTTRRRRCSRTRRARCFGPSCMR